MEAGNFISRPANSRVMRDPSIPIFGNKQPLYIVCATFSGYYKCYLYEKTIKSKCQYKYMFLFIYLMSS